METTLMHTMDITGNSKNNTSKVINLYKSIKKPWLRLKNDFIFSLIHSYNNNDYVDYPVHKYSSSPLIRVLQQMIQTAKNSKIRY